MDGFYVTAEDWAAAIDQLWHGGGGSELLAEACAMGVVVGVALCQETMQTSEDDNSVLISADGAWTVCLDPANRSCRAVTQTQPPARSVPSRHTGLLSHATRRLSSQKA